MIQKILIVDDSSVARLMIKSSIPSDKNYEIIVAVNGREGVEKYQEHKPDLTFMDITMPELDGFKATEEIIAFDKNATIIALTADIQQKSIERIKALGVYEVIQKPAQPDIIKAAIDSLASGR